MFAVCQIGAGSVVLGGYHHAKPEARYHNQANMPKGIETAKNWSRGAEAHALRIRADLLECNELSYGDCTTIDKYNRTRNKPKLTGAYVAWIPKLEYLYLQEEVIPKGDPAMLYRFGDEYYVCGLWDIPEEEPSEAILREFTEGSARIKNG